jgi:hypothetical protein
MSGVESAQHLISTPGAVRPHRLGISGHARLDKLMAKIARLNPLSLKFPVSTDRPAQEFSVDVDQAAAPAFDPPKDDGDAAMGSGEHCPKIYGRLRRGYAAPRSLRQMLTTCSPRQPAVPLQRLGNPHDACPVVIDQLARHDPDLHEQRAILGAEARPGVAEIGGVAIPQQVCRGQAAGRRNGARCNRLQSYKPRGIQAFVSERHFSRRVNSNLKEQDTHRGTIDLAVQVSPILDW